MRRNDHASSVGRESRRPFLSWFSALVVLAVVLGSPGCKKGGPKNKLSGKVTHKGKTVNGSVVFITSDGKEVPVPINPTDGTYSVGNLPTGQTKVMVKGMSGAGTAPPIPGGKSSQGLLKDESVQPPPKYALPANAIKFEVTGGDQTYDIDLK